MIFERRERYFSLIAIIAANRDAYCFWKGFSVLTETAISDFLFSSLADDPDLAELGDEFADEMPMKIDAILAAERQGNRELMVRLVHQLKGAAGSYGFSSITPFAARLEATLKSTAAPQSVSLQLDELVSICNRVRSHSKRPTC